MKVLGHRFSYQYWWVTLDIYISWKHLQFLITVFPPRSNNLGRKEIIFSIRSFKGQGNKKQFYIWSKKFCCTHLCLASWSAEARKQETTINLHRHLVTFCFFKWIARICLVRIPRSSQNNVREFWSRVWYQNHEHLRRQATEIVNHFILHAFAQLSWKTRISRQW